MIVVEAPVFLIAMLVLAVVLVYVAVGLALLAVAIPQMIMGVSVGFRKDFEEASNISASVSGIFFVYYIVSGMIYGMQSIKFPYLQGWIHSNVVAWADSPTSRQFMPPMAHYFAYIILGMLLTAGVAFVVTLGLYAFAKIFGRSVPEEEKKPY